MEVEIGCIQVGTRVRRDFGDIAALAASIDEIGLLQPIGISADHRLVFGERRLRAFQQLGRDTIPARIVNIDSLVRGEYAENEIRKDFTPSERVEIGRALEVELAGRAGNPNFGDAPIQENFPELPRGQTRDLAAQAAGFGNGKTYEQAKSVVDHGVPALVDAMDGGSASISAAAAVATLPKASQEGIVSQGEDGIVAAAREVREKRAHVANNSGNNEWYTPADYIEAARAVMGSIDTDPASSEIANRTVKAATFYTADDDGRAKPWRGNVWMNPPYAQPLIAGFAEAVASKFESGEIQQACVLVNNGTETGWFQRMLSVASAVCFPRSRIRFIDPAGNPSGAPLQGQAVLYMGENRTAFAAAFSEKGVVLFRG